MQEIVCCKRLSGLYSAASVLLLVPVYEFLVGKVTRTGNPPTSMSSSRRQAVNGSERETKMNKRNILTLASIVAFLLVPAALNAGTLGNDAAEPDYMSTEFVWVPARDVPDYMATEFVWIPVHSEAVASK